MKAITLVLIFLMFPALVLAHGGEDHRHEEPTVSPAAQAGASDHPRIETATETFEIVGQLRDGELSLLIDRYETNEPVLNGNVEVESDGRKATARFHADRGVYAIADQAFIKALAKPGKHALVFTVAAGEDMDLLEATMTTGKESQAAPEGARPAISLPAAAIVGALLSLVLAAVAITLARRKPSTGN